MDALAQWRAKHRSRDRALFGADDDEEEREEIAMARWKATGPKPPTRFCWECSRQLYGRQFKTITGPDGHKHAVHKSCGDANVGHEEEEEDHGTSETERSC